MRPESSQGAGAKPASRPGEAGPREGEAEHADPTAQRKPPGATTTSDTGNPDRAPTAGGNAQNDQPDQPDQPIQSTQSAQLAQLESQLAQARDLARRARADYDNLQKRVEREALQERDRIKARVLEGFLPVFELTQMAAAQARTTSGPLGEGIVLMAREFERLLEREGIIQVGEVGEPFDARRHEAVAHEPAPGLGPGRVARVVQPGYRFGDRILRFAKVAVSA